MSAMNQVSPKKISMDFSLSAIGAISPMGDYPFHINGSEKLYEKPEILISAPDMEKVFALKEEAEVFDAKLNCEILKSDKGGPITGRFDIFLLDLSGLEREGFDFIKRQKFRNRGADLIIITDSDDVNFYKKAMKIGAFDCFSKPYSRKELQVSISELIKKRRNSAILELKDNYEKELASDKEQINYIMSMVESLVLALEARDMYTKGHSERVTGLAVEMAVLMRLDKRAVDNLRHASRLHDIGKIGIKDAILKKPAALTVKEREVMMSHPILGEEILRPLSYFSKIMPAIRHHHERYDGRGYPDGLSGLKIPLEARIIAVADAYDAMRSDRPYRKGMGKSAALAEIEKGRGGQFDPSIASLLIRIINEKAEFDNLYQLREDNNEKSVGY